MKDVICIVGPTATGKTALSVRLAQKYGAEIVSCDSMQLYRGMDVGTAKPTKDEMGGVPHHMIDCLDPREPYSVSRYVEDADRCVQDILRRDRRVIVVGGTGLYVDSLIAGRQFAPFPETGRREELTRIAETQGIEVLMERLRSVDPDAAAKIHPSNRKRVIRALEIYLETGKTMTAHDLETKMQPARYDPCWIGLDYVNRETLYRRIDLRVERMMEQGLAGEVRALLNSGVPAGATAMQAIGYKELTAYLRGEGTQEGAVAAIQQASRRYAKRQRTWFRRNGAIRWIELPDAPFDPFPAACAIYEAPDEVVAGTGRGSR
ncbi:MAG: tRNA (adenosine(37)-N6)-dimethylallyltransferase MiaA [Oscillospiraceae bacterium]|nr:tRNA (adenosine(37)-N6)-dimethylallyltransferase MiaA [Oscillospiraceae bacterium]